jgi:hypothetical protein
VIKKAMSASLASITHAMLHQSLVLWPIVSPVKTARVRRKSGPSSLVFALKERMQRAIVSKNGYD